METECRPMSNRPQSSEANEPQVSKSKLRQCYEKAARVFLQPATQSDGTKNNDFTKCVFKDFYNMTDICDDGSCQMPAGT